MEEQVKFAKSMEGNVTISELDSALFVAIIYFVPDIHLKKKSDCAKF